MCEIETVDTPILKACDCPPGPWDIHMQFLLKAYQYPEGQRSMVKKPKAELPYQDDTRCCQI